jgi:hypothetical protein
MELTSTLQNSESATAALAPWWHTLLVLVPLAAGSIASAYQNGLPDAHLRGLGSRLSSYFTVIAEEWLVFFLIWLALKSREISVGSLVSGRWPTLRSFFRDLALAMGFLVVVLLLLSILLSCLGLDKIAIWRPSCQRPGSSLWSGSECLRAPGFVKNSSSADTSPSNSTLGRAAPPSPSFFRAWSLAYPMATTTS